MAAVNQTIYCCNYADVPFQEVISGVCDGSWTIEVNSASSPNTFGNFNNSFILSRTCAKMASPPCFGGTAAGQIIVGCVPQSLFPITVNLTLKRNNAVVKSFNQVIQKQSSVECVNCENMCGVLS